MRLVIGLFLSAVSAIFFLSCGDKNEFSPTLFELMPANKTGISFANEIAEDESLNILTYEYFYNGAGVGAGDFNNDGLQDLFFSSNMGRSRLYLNNGNFTFRDFTDSAGINTEGKWATGVSIVDINQDGLDDIYLCFSGPHGADKRANALFINNGNAGFTDKAAAYGLADTGHSVQAVFFDYDRDNDLDMYLLTNITDETGPNVIRPKRINGEMANTDRLYRNNGNSTFTDVSREAGILKEGYGLGVAVTDINEDGWPDIFVSNDYVSNNLLYINNHDGTFTDIAGRAFRHTSYSAMGNDVADINNDGRADIIEVDMLPPDNFRQKLMLGATNHDRYRSEIQYGYDPQFMRNTLQLNRGLNNEGLPVFSEMAQLAGVHATDWSWSPLLADFDNDGWKDLLITNGYPRDITNRDFINYRAQEMMHNSQGEALGKQRFAALQKLDGALLHNFLFKNSRDLTYKDVSAEWGMRENVYSSGAAYADLDNDGDLDLIIVNTGAPAGVYRNNSEKITKNKSVAVSLRGPKGNLKAYGSKISLFAGELMMTQELYPVRGYQSTVQSAVSFGIGEKNSVDSIIVTWPDGRQSKKYTISPGEKIEFVYSDSSTEKVKRSISAEPVLFRLANNTFNIHFRHAESPYTDFNIQPLLPHKFSQSGPGIAIGDVNGDGRDDFFAGGAYKQAGQLFIQQPNGAFRSIDIEEGKKPEEDMGVLLFDADNDDDLDLYIVSGGNEYAAGSRYYQDRLYRNDGHGRFSYDATALPVETESGSCVVAADFDADGDLDLFVGGKINPQQYPQGGRSFILENINGRFVDVTNKTAEGLQQIGMVNSAVWSDINNDAFPDLVIAGEWMPITVFINRNGKFHNATAELGLANTVGWWNSVQGGDFNCDGKTDFIAGNLGMNSRYKTSAENPMEIFINDFGNGRRMGIITSGEDGRRFPVHPRDDLMLQLPALRKKVPLYADYGRADIDGLFDKPFIEGAQKIRADIFQSVVLINNGSKPWTIKPLPVEAQMAPLFGILVNDYTGDGIEDVLLTGNFYGSEVINGRYDAFTGLLLEGRGNSDFKVNDQLFRMQGDGKGLAEIIVKKNQPLVLAACNDDTMKVFEHLQKRNTYTWKAAHDDHYALVKLENGKTFRREFYYGSGYLSSTGRYLRVPSNALSVEIFSRGGRKRSLPLR